MGEQSLQPQQGGFGEQVIIVPSLSVAEGDSVSEVYLYSLVSPNQPL